jgi:glutamyl-tRNA synthetase
MQTKSDVELTDLFIPILEEKGISIEKNYIQKVIASVKERAVFVNDFWALSIFFFITPNEYDAKNVKKNWKEGTPDLMQELISVISLIEDFSSENTEKVIKEWISGKEIGFGKVMQPLRLSLVGKLAGPHLFDIIAMIGREETIKRLENAIKKL